MEAGDVAEYDELLPEYCGRQCRLKLTAAEAARGPQVSRQHLQNQRSKSNGKCNNSSTLNNSYKRVERNRVALLSLSMKLVQAQGSCMIL